MKSITLSSLLLLSAFFIGCSPKAQTTETKKTSTRVVVANPVVLSNPGDFKQQIANGNVQLVDIRTPQEYYQGHMNGALNYNFYKPEFMKQMNTLDKSKPVYIYCRSGHRTSIASKKMAKAGFSKIYELRGGINNWLRNGYKLMR